VNVFALSRLLKNSFVPFSPREKVRMRGSKTMGYDCYDAPSPQPSPGGRGGVLDFFNTC